MKIINKIFIFKIYINKMNTDMEFKIGNFYKILMNKKLGSGAFGEIYQGRDFN
jgi:hypothetical protein